MYGDCQVLSSLGGNMVSPETIFSSVGNPNYGFLANIPFHGFPSIKEEKALVLGKEEIDHSGSGSELHIDDKCENELDMPPSKKKRYHRHTLYQIQEMEAMFKECQHPDDKQRLKLSQDLGLKPRQVKFWFQNRRTQLKAQQDRTDNVMLRAENETLKSDNYRLQAELRSLVCNNCVGGGSSLTCAPYDDLRMENARLREELERVCCITSRFTGRQVSQLRFVPSPLEMYPAAEIMPLPSLPTEMSAFESCMIMEEEKALAMELAVSSMNALVKMARSEKPLWKSTNGKDVLNVEEYSKVFPWLAVKCLPELKTEATRESRVVIMNSINLVEAFLDANKWLELFPSIVARAKTLQILSNGVSGQCGVLQLMYAEFQVLSPLVPTRETYFLRFCQQNQEEGSWVIVDLPIDSLHANLQPSFPVYKRMPSGCVIQDMPNGYSRVTWVEHCELQETHVHESFRAYVDTCMAFGAHRWLAVLQRQCERVASMMARNISDLGVIPSPEARRNLMRLAQRMIATFSVNISSSCGQSWTALSDSLDDTVRIMTRKNTDPGQPNGIILCAVSTAWLPYNHRHVFDLLKDEHRRSQLDILSNGGSPLHKVAHIANGSNPGNCISLLRVNVASNSSHHVELVFQETTTDTSGSMVVNANVDVDSIQLVMNGEDPSCIPLLPLGFSIVPMESATSPTLERPNNVDGCLLTVGLQVLASTMASGKLNLSSVTAINNHLTNMVRQITNALTV